MYKKSLKEAQPTQQIQLADWWQGNTMATRHVINTTIFKVLTFHMCCWFFLMHFIYFTGLLFQVRRRQHWQTRAGRYTYFFVRSICQLASCGAKVVIRLSSWLVSVYSLLETGLKLNALLFVQQLCWVPMSPYRRDQLVVPSQSKWEGLWQRRWETMKERMCGC